MIPGGTYRLQLHAGFGFEEAAALAAYLAELAVSHVYCSPYLQARRGSTHGYDVIDPLRVSDDLGGAAGHAVMVGAFHEAGLSHLIDIVPNHMAADADNPWWWDVLENGAASRFARVFDIEWDRGDEHSHLKVLVPILEDHYGRVLEAGLIRVRRHRHRFHVVYLDRRLPVSPTTLPDMLAPAARHAGDADLAALAEAHRGLEPRPVGEPGIASRHQEKEELAHRFRALLEDRPELGAAIDAELAALDTDHDRLDAVLGEQHYRLAYWRMANEELDYRRFFNIETLVGVRVEDNEVFSLTHGLITDLVREGTVSGLRVDHVDGLRDPAGYLRRLAAATEPHYLVVEKILERSESLPDDWPVAGTTGYDFLNRVNQVFVAAESADDINALYTTLTGEPSDYSEVVLEAKRQIIRNQLAAELHRLTDLLVGITASHRRHRDHTRRDLADALVEVIAGYSVYRTYVPPGGVAEEIDRKRVSEAVAATEHPDRELIRFLGALASGDLRETESEREFTQRLQQLTAPVMAKGVEDTAFYRFNRFVSLNEVGGDPGCFGRSVDWFHHATERVARRWPHTMLTLTTHDTKRSADVRARLNVLAEIPKAWRSAVEHWIGINEPHRDDEIPDRNTQYLLYQTLVGAWPIETSRVTEYMTKAAREARVHTSWVRPDNGFEEALRSFVDSTLTDSRFRRGLEDFLREHDIVDRGRRNSLSQTALLMTAPGVPDIYQGDELWNLSLVDPDNRRPVDYPRRLEMLRSLGEGAPRVDANETGMVKMAVLSRLLAHRSANPELYSSSGYEPIPFRAKRDGLLAFRRERLVVVALVRSRPEPGSWVSLPHGRWRDVIDGTVFEGGDQEVAELTTHLPFSVLTQDRS